jgi:hypothetical protein
MSEEARIRLLSGVRVSLLVLSEVRLAMREGRDHCPVAMHAAAEWALVALDAEVWTYNQRRKRRDALR